MKKKLFCMAFAAMMTVGFISLHSCDKQNESQLIKPHTELSHKAAYPTIITITILEPQPGKKDGKIGHKTCIGSQGTCWLWFKGLFLAEEFDLENAFPKNLASNTNCGSFVSDQMAGVHAAPVVNDSLDLLYDFSCVDSIDAQTWLSDIANGVSCINDTIIFSDESLLDAWNRDTPVAIPCGNYTIRSYDTTSMQYFIRVPLIKIQQ